MKILYHHRTLGDGAEGIHIASMVEAMRALGHEVRVVSLVGQETNVTTPRTKLLTALTRRLPRTVYESMELAYSVVGYRWLLGHMREWKPDFLYERYTLFNYAGLAAARRAKIPFVLEVNAPLAYERQQYERLSLQRIANYYEADLCARADLVVVVSTPLKEYLVKLGASPDRVLVLPNGADPGMFHRNSAARARIRERLAIAPDDMVVGFSGILRPWHGVELLLDAAGRLAAEDREPTVLIVGDGPSRVDLERIARQKKLRKVRFTGRVPHASTAEYLSAFDVGVSPRATFYASPMKIPEYMAMGIPVVAPRMPNIEDLIADGEDGVLFTQEDPESLAAALRFLYDRPYRRATIGRAALDSILTRRTWRHNAATVLKRVDARGSVESVGAPSLAV